MLKEMIDISGTLWYQHFSNGLPIYLEEPTLCIRCSLFCPYGSMSRFAVADDYNSMRHCKRAGHYR